jgi:ubiquinol-cytochrome c reductase cytochrome b subunit
MIVSGVTFALAGLVQINPVWLYGPYTPYTVSAGSQPDWYIAWLDGSVRLWPHWEFRSWGHEIANPFFPGLLIPGIVFTIMYAWPWIDKRIYNDYRAHNLLDRPRDKPFRTGVGVAAIMFFIDLTLACGTDLLANDFHVSFERLIEILQYGALIGPALGFAFAYYACKALQRTGAHPIMKPIGGVIIRDSHGAYHTLGDVHADGHGENGHAVDAHAGNGHATGDGASETAPAATGAATGHGPSAAGSSPEGGASTST